VELATIPVANALLPRPDGGVVRGMFVDPAMARVLKRVGEGGAVFLCPFVAGADGGGLYPVGVVARLEGLWREEVFCGPAERRAVVLARVRGVGRARARGFAIMERLLVATAVEPLDLDDLREGGYPTICGAGWRATSGRTDMRSVDDLVVTIHGVDLEGGDDVALQSNLGRLLEPEQAHTVEHAIIRSLQQYALCTPKTLISCIAEETDELKDSLDLGFRRRLPEVFGITNSGACGNPLTNLAQFYLAQEIVGSLADGQSLRWSVHEARRKTLSRLAADLEFTTQAGLRTLQGLKKGMMHDDTAPSPRHAAAILKRFPATPWE